MEDKPQFQHVQSQSTTPAFGQVYSKEPDLTELVSQVQLLKQQLDILSSRRVSLETDVIGMFETVTTAPTSVPVSPYNQFKVAVIAGTTYLYVFDNTNKAWKRVVIA